MAVPQSCTALLMNLSLQVSLMQCLHHTTILALVASIRIDSGVLQAVKDLFFLRRPPRLVRRLQRLPKTITRKWPKCSGTDFSRVHLVPLWVIVLYLKIKQKVCLLLYLSPVAKVSSATSGNASPHCRGTWLISSQKQPEPNSHRHLPTSAENGGKRAFTQTREDLPEKRQKLDGTPLGTTPNSASTQIKEESANGVVPQNATDAKADAAAFWSSLESQHGETAKKVGFVSHQSWFWVKQLHSMLVYRLQLLADSCERPAKLQGFVGLREALNLESLCQESVMDKPLN